VHYSPPLAATHYGFMPTYAKRLSYWLVKGGHGASFRPAAV
jgi:hypothetical protein